MINKDLLLSLAADLEGYRDREQNLIQFDGRDPGNYLGYHLQDTYDFLLETDPSGLALGLMLAEMVEATVQGSRVPLVRVLREQGYIDQLERIQHIERQILDEVREPRARLIQRLTASMGTISGSLGVPTNREVTVCLRDALYCIHSGLTLRWLTLSPEAPAAPTHLPLCVDVTHWPDLPGFLDALRTEMPMGAHLARVGKTDTVIGLKSPGRIAYLSSLTIKNGRMRELRAHMHHMAESFDLDTAVERYPDWLPPAKPFHAHDNPYPQSVKVSPINTIADLPRDRLMWLAMVVEMSVQRMADVTGEIELVETLSRAAGDLVPLLAHSPSAASYHVPALIQPNWCVELPSIETLFAGLGFSEWERAFLEPGLTGLTTQMLFQVGERDYGINLHSMKLVEWESEGGRATLDMCAFEREHVRMTCVSSALAGTRSEVLASQISVLEHNLAAFLMAWGNCEFLTLYRAWMPSYLAAVTSGLPASLDLSFARMMRPNNASGRTPLSLFSQKAGRKSFDPWCYFNRKKTVDHVARFEPQSFSDLVALMGLSSESELPQFLRGWSREMSWATTSRRSISAFDKVDPSAPVYRDAPCRTRWCFCDDEVGAGVERHEMFRVEVWFNVESLPGSVKIGQERHIPS